jgi:arginyl-tRNA synthetase
MNISEEIKALIIEALKTLGIEHNKEIVLEHPDESNHGDYSSNIALVISKQLKQKPIELAGNIVEAIKTKLDDKSKIFKVEIAGPGFINFFLSNKFVAEKICSIVGGEQKFGHSSEDNNKQVLVEYTDPNTFKVFHIGHLMSNSIGESIARLIESSGTKVFRICYPSDIGLHIAKAIWAIEKNISNMPDQSVSIQEKTDFLGKMYVLGTKTYDEDPIAKKEIDQLNKKIYEKSDQKINDIYEKGRKWSLDHFELLYKLLGTKFDKYIYESEMAEIGKQIVKQGLDKGVFEISEGATVFKGEKYSLHTRVFINSQDLPTYEAKDLGLNITKFKNYPDAEESIIITANEQNDYFKVLKQVFLLIDEKNGSKTKHIGHGMMRFLSGKMSSRTGNVITAEALISDIKDLVKEKIQDRKFSTEENEEIANIVAVGAIKYTILRSSIGSNIIFDSASSNCF